MSPSTSTAPPYVWDPFSTTILPIDPSATPLVITNEPLVPLENVLAQVYLWAGIVFVTGLAITSIAVYLYYVAYKGDYSASPPFLELYPEVSAYVAVRVDLS